MLVGDGLAIVLDFIRFAGQHDNDILAFLDHGIQGRAVIGVVLTHLYNDGVEVAVMQLLGKS